MSETRTTEQIQQYLTAARDSVWVINDQLEKLAGGAQTSEEIKGNIERNVSHLKIVVAAEDVVASGQDISDLNSAISAGEAKLAENIWPTE